MADAESGVSTHFAPLLPSSLALSPCPGYPTAAVCCGSIDPPAMVPTSWAAPASLETRTANFVPGAGWGPLYVEYRRRHAKAARRQAVLYLDPVSKPQVSAEEAQLKQYCPTFPAFIRNRDDHGEALGVQAVLGNYQQGAETESCPTKKQVLRSSKAAGQTVQEHLRGSDQIQQDLLEQGHQGEGADEDEEQSSVPQQIPVGRGVCVAHPGGRAPRTHCAGRGGNHARCAGGPRGPLGELPRRGQEGRGLGGAKFPVGAVAAAAAKGQGPPRGGRMSLRPALSCCGFWAPVSRSRQSARGGATAGAGTGPPSRRGDDQWGSGPARLCRDPARRAAHSGLARDSGRRARGAGRGTARLLPAPAAWECEGWPSMLRRRAQLYNWEGRSTSCLERFGSSSTKCLNFRGPAHASGSQSVCPKTQFPHHNSDSYAVPVKMNEPTLTSCCHLPSRIYSTLTSSSEISSRTHESSCLLKNLFTPLLEDFKSLEELGRHCGRTPFGGDLSDASLVVLQDIQCDKVRLSSCRGHVKATLLITVNSDLDHPVKRSSLGRLSSYPFHTVFLGRIHSAQPS
eukprot:XP_008770457.1 PREDICTED: uncharacterized protein LOC102552068 [Rattus norvegicus]